MTSLTGMTGFARVSGASGPTHWTWEARSVNGKGLDIRLRLPNEFSAIEAPLKKMFSAMFARGNMQISLNFQDDPSSSAYDIDEVLFDRLKSFVQQRHGTVTDGDVLNVPGVVLPSVHARDEATQARLEASLLESARELANSLKTHRDAEGVALAPILTDALSTIEVLIRDAGALATAQPKATLQRTREKLAFLLGDDFPDDRIAQEAAIIAMKADICEELDRLKAHVEQANSLLSKGSPVGRKLDFLCQEFNRETNTLCSKSADIDLTRIGLELKSVIEKFREQAANVE